MNSKLILTATIIAVISIFVTVDPVNLFRPPSIKGAHNKLQSAELIHLIGAVGPESLAFDPNGEGPYTGVADGRILKWEGESHGWTEFAFTSPNRKECVRPFAPEMEHVCGRPLGLRFHHKTRELYIADAYFGLQMVGPNGGLATQLVTEAENHPFRFTNDLDIDEEEDVIYFTDTSTIYQRRQFISALLSSDKTGRLMKYDRSSKEVKVLLRDLAFANGVTLNKDKSFVLVAETTTSRIIRFWLQGPKTGSFDVFAELPGYPDNIRRNLKGEFWVALHSKRGIAAHWASLHPWVGRFLLRLPLNFKQLHSLMVGMKPHATAVKLNEEGKIVEVLEDGEGRNLRFISEVEEKNGKLWIGSVLTPFVGVFNPRV